MQDPEVKKWARVAKKAGWRVEPTKKGHITFLHPDKTVPPIVVAGTPSDRRGRKNALARFKRYGLDL